MTGAVALAERINPVAQANGALEVLTGYSVPGLPNAGITVTVHLIGITVTGITVTHYGDSALN